ncbi:tRNA (adenosine(37)-N6)-dimethylallyltransferase MiaA [Salinibacter altiplanensis]|uniref:tRNA (adenosine(37)-N6)-dimethylallyltransferase MiaA n=1 Tax=Salinibacter altiplanensis TaxID=1803181 RepID=UPI000C9FCE34|nr:tRNA (adenosine(37)-N6)-dimethylallyltransferase MiaA [Salinibacter altiplanensis]
MASLPAPDSSDPILTIAGPTAVGKTELSLDVAEQLNAEIVSVDSRQVYEELTIGTAKPVPEARRRVPHHFIGERSLHEPFSAGTYAEAANERIRDILAQGRRPLVVGGATLYLHALQYGLADIPDVDAEVRERLNRRLESEGRDALYEELEEIDPKQAAETDPTKTQKVIRALEVYHGTGRTLSHYYETQPEPPFDYVTVVLNRDREKLYDRTNRRVERMLDAGLLEEVRNVMDIDGVQLDEPPLSTIGYREPIQHLNGEIDYDEMVRLVKRNTRRYAKRQLTWFRRYDEYHWRSAPETGAEELVSILATALNSDHSAADSAR